MTASRSNPYVGLRPYQDDESLLFFGRNKQTLELLQRLHEHHFVAVVGSSGCGKSSLLRAGLIPSLKAGYLVDDSDSWLISVMKPGQDPMRNLCRALLQQLYQSTDEDAVSQLLQTLEEEGSDAILRLLRPLREKENTNFFLLIDQFEELFRFADGQKHHNQRDGAIDFVNIFLELAHQNELPIYVVLTMRSDFIGDCSEFRGLPEAMNQSLYLVPQLNRQELKMVIEAPAKLYGATVDASLTSRLLNDMGRVKDELPLLQHTLMRVWEYEMGQGKDGILNLDDLEAVGGLEQALSVHADEALKTLSKEEFQIAKKLFQALTTIDEHGRQTRRPVRYGDLLELTGADERQLDHVIDAFIRDNRSFLMIEHSEDKHENMVDISHESLIRQWQRLGRWVEEEGEAAAQYYKLSQDYTLYREGKRDLIAGTELELAWQWYESFRPEASWAKRYNDIFEECREFLDQSRQAEKREKRNKKRLKIGIWSLAVVILLGSAGLIAKPFIDEYQQALQAYNESKAEAEARFAEIKERKGAAQDGISPQESYLELLGFIREQSIFYKEEAIRDHLHESNNERSAEGSEADITPLLKDDIRKLRADILSDLRDLEEALDREYWILADSVGTVEAYTNYVQTASSYNFPEAAKYLDQAKEFLEDQSGNQEWTKAQTQNTVHAYLNFIKTDVNNAPGITKEDLSPLSQEALTRIREVSRVGWLFAGRTMTKEADDNSLMQKDRVFDLDLRLGDPAAEPNRIPRAEDVLRAGSNRTAYNEFTGNSVKGKKGAFIKNGDLVLVLERKLLGQVVFLKVAY